MKHKLVKGLGILSIVLLSCTLLCGIWVGTHKGSDLQFHAMLSGVSVGIALIVQIVFMSKCKFCGAHKMQTNK